MIIHYMTQKDADNIIETLREYKDGLEEKK